MITNSYEWREFYKSPGATAMCMSRSWLKDGCPKCGSKHWQATSDCWVYCMDCNKGFPTDYPFTDFGDTITEFNFSEIDHE